MIVPNQMIEMRWNGSNKQYYISKGYTYTKHNDVFLVKVEDLTKSNNNEIQCICDYCGEIVYKRYGQAIKQEKHCCNKCKGLKIVETNLKRYGVRSTAQLKETQEKYKQTCLKKYGVENAFQNKKIREKYKQTNLNRYGVESHLYLKEMQEKRKQTMENKYGVQYTAQSKELRQKMKQTNLKKYNVEHAMQNKKIKEKQLQTLYENGTAPCSKQQRYLCELFNGELNYLIDSFLLDIAFINDKLYIEYDGGGHDLQVKLGTITEKEFKQKEIVRGNILKNKGWKVIRIISNKDKLLQNEDLLKLFNHCKNFLLTTNHTWIYIDIDKMTIKCNAYEKNIEEIL